MSDQEPRRLFFGNPGKTLGMKPLPPGERKAFGEQQLQPAREPAPIPGNVKVLAYGNRPAHPMAGV